MNSWRLPLDLECLGPTSDSMSFQNIDITKQYHIPVMASDEIGEQHHVGAFGCTRKHNRHSGVDLYCPEGTPVYAVEYGTILKIDHWTGPKDNTPWWLDTDAVYVQGQYGVVVYGEIEVNKDLHVGDLIHPSDLIGKVKRVLRKGYCGQLKNEFDQKIHTQELINK